MPHELLLQCAQGREILHVDGGYNTIGMHLDEDE